MRSFASVTKSPCNCVAVRQSARSLVNGHWDVAHSRRFSTKLLWWLILVVNSVGPGMSSEEHLWMSLWRFSWKDLLRGSPHHPESPQLLPGAIQTQRPLEEKQCCLCCCWLFFLITHFLVYFWDCISISTYFPFLSSLQTLAYPHPSKSGSLLLINCYCVHAYCTSLWISGQMFAGHH